MFHLWQTAIQNFSPVVGLFSKYFACGGRTNFHFCLWKTYFQNVLTTVITWRSVNGKLL